MIVECPGCRSRYDVTGRPAGTLARCRCGTQFNLPDPPQSADGLRCPSCDANVPPTNHRCAYCSAELLIKSCPRCFGRVFHGAKYCNACGASIDVAAKAGDDGMALPLTCPRCEREKLTARLIGDVLMDECQRCYGIWLDVGSMEKVVLDRKQTPLDSLLAPPPSRQSYTPIVAPGGKMYLKCPECETIMNRTNFSRVSGVIVDVCKNHGTWFDQNELPQIVEFVREGGLERAAEARLEAAEEDKRRARAAHAAMAAELAKPGHAQGRWGHYQEPDILGELANAVSRWWRS